MKRRDFIQKTPLAAATAVSFPSFFLSCNTNRMIPIQSGQTGPYRFQEIRRGVGYFEEKGGTIGWSLHTNGISVVDTQFPDQAKNLLAELDKYKSGGKIDLLINTHHHGDHTSGNIVLKDRIIQHAAHENAIENYKRVAAEQNTTDKAVFPTLSFKDTMRFDIGHENITLYYFGAAHTNGDAIVLYEKANVVHLADLIFNRRFPYIDKTSGADIQSWVKVLDKVMTTFPKDTVFIFGHKGEGYEVTGGHDDVRAFQNYLEKLLEYGRSCIASGKSLEEVKATTQSIPGAEEWKGDGISRSLDAVYAELAGE
jgi:glyoxylase-like metal-dependent hydrolase (beta-lactamase superfamily II)